MKDVYAVPGLALALCLTILTVLPRQAPAEPIVTEAFINAPIATVWSLFATGEGRRTNVAQAQVDLSLGGQIRTHRDPEGELGDAETMVEIILAYEPERMLATRIQQAPAGSSYGGANLSGWNVLYLAAAGEDMTHVRLVALGYGEAAENQALREYIAGAHRRELDQIAKKFWPVCARCAAETDAERP
jgi:uncharacterized protein YndB with AHSA1/START domain